MTPTSPAGTPTSPPTSCTTRWSPPASSTSPSRSSAPTPGAPAVDELTTVLTVLLHATPDPQRGTTLPADPDLVADLARSLDDHGHRLTVLTDCLDDHETANVTFVRVKAGENPYFHRWT